MWFSEEYRVALGKDSPSDANDELRSKIEDIGSLTCERKKKLNADIYRPKTKFGDGNVFTGVYLSGKGYVTS